MEKREKQIPVELTESAAEGTYSNFVLTSHTPSEFVLDFARILPGVNKAKVLSRIVMTPQSAKSLLKVLAMTVEKFEEKFGEIELRGKRCNDHVIGFQTGAAEEEAAKGKKKG